MKMNCRQWDALHEEYLSGALDPIRCDAFLSHADDCPRCRAILDFGAVDLPSLGDPDDLMDVPSDLLPGVLEQTSGSACRRAEDLLAADAAPIDDQRALLDAHLEHCESCGALARIMTWMVPELARMKQIEPEAGLVYDVLRASNRYRSRKRSGWLVRRQDRLQLWWEEVFARPRFAWEVAFVATVILTLVFGTPISPARKAPSQALQVVQAGPGRVIESASRIFDDIGRGVDSLRDDIDIRNSRTGPDRADVKRHGLEIGRSVLNADLSGAAAGLGTVGEDIGSLWNKWKQSQSDTLIGESVNQPSVNP